MPTTDDRGPRGANRAAERWDLSGGRWREARSARQGRIRPAATIPGPGVASAAIPPAAAMRELAEVGLPKARRLGFPRGHLKIQDI